MAKPISFNIIYERGGTHNIINKHVSKLESDQKTTAASMVAAVAMETRCYEV